MDKIQMIIEKYGDDIKVGYDVIKHQAMISDIGSLVFAIGFFSLIAFGGIFTAINLAQEKYDSDYFDKSDNLYKYHKKERIMVYLNIFGSIASVLMMILSYLFIAIYARDYLLLKSLF